MVGEVLSEVLSEALSEGNKNNNFPWPECNNITTQVRGIFSCQPGACPVSGWSWRMRYWDSLRLPGPTLTLNHCGTLTQRRTSRTELDLANIFLISAVGEVNSVIICWLVRVIS